MTAVFFCLIFIKIYLCIRIARDKLSGYLLFYVIKAISLRNRSTFGVLSLKKIFPFTMEWPILHQVHGIYFPTYIGIYVYILQRYNKIYIKCCVTIPFKFNRIKYQQRKSYCVYSQTILRHRKMVRLQYLYPILIEIACKFLKMSCMCVCVMFVVWIYVSGADAECGEEFIF